MMQTAYNTDFTVWATEQALLLRSGNFAALNIEHLAEEVDAMSAKEKSELRNRLEVLLQHLLKWQFQSMRRVDTWTTTLFEQRLNIRDILADSPSLDGVLKDSFDSAYDLAVHHAANETGLSLFVFPKTCPYNLDEVLMLDWFPPDAP